MSNMQNRLQDMLFDQDEVIFGEATKYITPQPTLKHKKNIIAVLLATYLMYRMSYQTSLEPGQCIKDLTHGFTQFINVELNKDGDFAYYFMVVGQLFVDIQLMVFIIFQMFKVQNFYLCTFIGLFYGVRAVFLNIEKFPYPQNVYWDEPGFPPSIGVPYGITSDYFYSGHTGIMLFSILFWSQKSQTRILKYIAMVGFPYIILLVISSRVHYIVDVFAAIFFCLWIFRFSQQQLIQLDRFFSKGYHASICILGCLDSALMFICRMKKNSKDKQRSAV